MDADRLRQRLIEAAQEPAATEGVADTVIERIATEAAASTGLLGSIIGKGVLGLGTLALVAAAAGGALGFFAGDGDGGSVGALPPAGVVIPTYACPGEGQLGSLQGGDRIFATAQDASGEWLAIRDPRDLDRRVWVAAAAIIPDSSMRDLPVDGCDDAGTLIIAGETIEPTTTTSIATPTTEESTTTTVADATTTTTAPPTTTTTEPADTTGPVISNASATPGQIWETFGGLCDPNPHTSTISATASDPSGVDTMTAAWAFEAVDESETMTGGATRTATMGPYPYLTVPDVAPYTVDVTVTITATDNLGNSSQTSVVVTVTGAGECFA